jgi:glycosyltransferase involved in cell wall biosynthesis
MTQDVKELGPERFATVVAMTELFVFPRLYVRNDEELEATRKIFDFIHRCGKKIVYEVDDDYTNTYRTVHDGDSISVAKMADAITVTTPYLGEMMTRLTKRKHYILPNMLDPALWKDAPAPERKTDKVVIGLTGSSTHGGDWRVLETVMPKILDELGDRVHFVIGGYHPEYMSELPNTEYLPAVPYQIYSQLIRSCDIVLAPVDPDDKFNDGKSAIKAIEGQGAARELDGQQAGACVIATHNKVYSLDIKDGKTGFLVHHKPESWYNAICQAILDSSLRKEIQYNAFRRTWKQRDISKGAALWGKAYLSILNK